MCRRCQTVTHGLCWPCTGATDARRQGNRGCCRGRPRQSSRGPPCRRNRGSQTYLDARPCKVLTENKQLQDSRQCPQLVELYQIGHLLHSRIDLVAGERRAFLLLVIDVKISRWPKLPIFGPAPTRPGRVCGPKWVHMYLPCNLPSSQHCLSFRSFRSARLIQKERAGRSPSYAHHVARGSTLPCDLPLHSRQSLPDDPLCSAMYKCRPTT